MDVIAASGTESNQAFLSLDSGASWHLVAESLDSLPIVAIENDPRDNARLYGAVVRSTPLISYLYESLDSGQSWSLAAEFPDLRIEGLAINPHVGGLAGTFAFGSRPVPAEPPFAPRTRPEILRQDVSGAWISSASGLTGSSVSAIAVNPVDPCSAYAGTNTGVFRLEDCGSTWTATGQGLGCGSVTALVVSPDGASVYAASASLGGRETYLCSGRLLCAGVFRRDDGQPWRSFGFSDVFVTDLAVTAAEPAWVFASTASSGGAFCHRSGRGVYASLNRGESWRRMGLVSTQALEIDPAGASIFAATESGVFHRAIPPFIETADSPNRTPRRSHRLW